MKAALVFASVRVSRDTCALPLIVDPAALVPDIFTGPCVLSIAMLLVIDPLSFVLVDTVFCLGYHLSVAITLVVCPHSGVNRLRLVAVNHSPVAILFAFSPFAIILVFC